jgi:uncharacterized RDD family membrane protein YckC
MTEQINYAGFWMRFSAAIIDTLILWIPCSLFRLVFVGDSESISLLIVDLLQMTFIWCLYYGFLESSGKEGTLGKQILGLRVCDINRNQLSFTHGVARYLMGFVAATPFGIGLMMVGWTKQKQGLHDIICKCLVVRRTAS